MLCEVDEVPNIEGKPVLAAVLPKTLKEEDGVLVVVVFEVEVVVVLL